jgi:hypothetical protein
VKIAIFSIIVCIFIGFIIYLWIKEHKANKEVFRKVLENYISFKHDSETRVIRENKGYGNVFYPQFLDGNVWEHFFYKGYDSNFKECVAFKNFQSRAAALEYIADRRAKIKNEFEIV